MSADSKRRSFPEFAKLLSKDQGWADEESALQEILGAFLCGQISNVTWPHGDIPVRPDGVHVVTMGRDSTGWPIDIRLTVPPQEPVSREEWLVGLHSGFGGDLGRKCKELGLGFEGLAEISISEYPPTFRQAYIDSLYATDAEFIRWLRGLSRLNRGLRSKGGSKPKYNVALQQFIDQLAAEFKEAGRPFTPSVLETWLSTNASQGEGYESQIPDCDDIELYDDRVWWVDSQGRRDNRALKSIERYVQRANNRASHKTV